MLEQRIGRFIESYGAEGDFSELALDVFAHQYESVELYRRFCDARAVVPGSIDEWAAIPAVPADIFKYGPLEENHAHVFLSSGTSVGSEQPSRHALSSLATYRRSALTHFARMVVPDQPGPMATLLVGPSATTHPHSSLGQMFSWCIETHASDGSLQAFDGEGRVDLDAALAWLEQRAAATEPILLLGISSAFTAIFERLRASGRALRLPADSRLVDTGGAKGTARVLSPRGLLKASWRFLHIPAYLCINEYGMTEMLSQFYDDALASRHEGRLTPRSKVGPPWVKTTAVDPATLEPVADGKTGLLRHFDLANWETLSALQTADLGRTVGIGFELRGRATGAEARGCSQLLVAVRGTHPLSQGTEEP